ncbi:rifin [Plasmodium reichenowi]|uniref:Rifin n=1 Tax=Plasmodium reichenowi TaxID=5854 RepID=A0A060RLY7_PLARE|nr:rifin [Plasmodium reichenowi]
MKLHYFKILLFFYPLNIFAYNNNNEPSITPHHTTIYTSRVLSEKDIRSTNYDKDTGMKSVMQQFVDRTSQRFEEYEERMKEKRQKRKEQRDKNIQKIIEKDKMEKSLAEKIEKCCLKCGCALGGVAASVGIFGTVAVKELAKTATAAAVAAAEKAGTKAGIQAVIAKIKKGSLFDIAFNGDWSNFIKPSNYNIASGLYDAVTNALTSSEKTCSSSCATIRLAKQELSNWETTLAPYVKAGKDAAADKIATVQTAELGKVTTQSTQLYGAIGYSVLAILIIVLIMLIIYLILRYRRKKKMKKKAQYTKLLNQ